MDFDIHSLDQLIEEDMEEEEDLEEDLVEEMDLEEEKRLDEQEALEEEKLEEKLEEYAEALVTQFYESPEGQALVEKLKDYQNVGFFSAELIYYGFMYVEKTIPQMDVNDVEEIVMEWFPRKITLSSPDHANYAIPELRAFWEFLKRKYRLEQCDYILNYLRRIEPGYNRIMNDPSKFGTAKSFFTKGINAGFDMNKEEDIQRFTEIYNKTLSISSMGGLYKGITRENQEQTIRKKDKEKKKKLRKMAKASRKKNIHKKKRR